MKYKMSDIQLKKVSSKLESNLNSYFSSDDRICGFKIYVNDDDDDNSDELLEVYILINKEWSDNDNWSTLRIGRIADEVKTYLRDITPLTFGVYYYPKKC